MNGPFYIAISAALRKVQPDRKPITDDSFEHEATVEMHAACAQAIADALARLDPSTFDAQRFVLDAGVDLETQS